MGIENGWFQSVNKLTNIKIDPNNHVFKIHENRMIIGKSSVDQDNFNVLVCSFEQKEIISIPNFIEIIGSNSFGSNKKFKKPLFSKDSRLKIIDKNAFSLSNIEFISIPKNVTEIRAYAFYSCKNLQKIGIPDDSNLQVIENDAFHSTKIKSISLPSHLINFNTNIFGFGNNVLIIEINEFSSDMNLCFNVYMLPRGIIIMVSFKNINDSKFFSF